MPQRVWVALSWGLEIQVSPRGRRVSQRSIPASQSVPFLFANPLAQITLNTCGQICPDSQKVQFLGVRKEERLSSPHSWASLPIPHLSPLVGKILRGQRQKLGDVSEARWWVKTWPLGLSGRLGLRCLWDPLSCKGVN